jgi:hypothetical protein
LSAVDSPDEEDDHPCSPCCCNFPVADRVPTACVAQQQSPAQPTANQSSSNPDNPEEEITSSGQVVIDGRLILTVYESVATLTPEARAQRIAGRVIALARDGSIPAESVRLQSRNAWTRFWPTTP